KILERARPDMNADFDGRSLAEAVMAPTRIYVKPLLALMDAVPVKGMAHITGGGLLDNVPRILKDSLVATLDSTAWTRPKLFDWLQREGQVADAEMHRVFNCGIGMVVVVAQSQEEKALKLLREAGETAWSIGMICRRGADQPQTIVA
ncbi:MAG: AIR synthase-related protein, partial [Rhodocyclaceae bacterium]